MMPRLEKFEQAHTPRRANSPLPVVGASAAGLFTAFLLARENVPVDVLETSPQLDPLSRTLIVTHKMRQLLGPLAEPRITNEISKFELFTDGRSATVKLDRPDLVIERVALIRSLADAAQRAGANLRFGRRFQGLSDNGAQLTIHCQRVEDRAPEQRHTSIVVGGDGAASRLARAAGWPAQATVPLIQAIVNLPPDMSLDTVRVWFVPDDMPYFYWLIPRGATEGVLGLIGEAGAETRILLERFLKKKAFSPIKFGAARIPVYTGWVDVAATTPVTKRSPFHGACVAANRACSCWGCAACSCVIGSFGAPLRNHSQYGVLTMAGSVVTSMSYRGAFSTTAVHPVARNYIGGLPSHVYSGSFGAHSRFLRRLGGG
jgi:2-polyprenyl-6-methoxyphenol hydroxylase-like FAD-dependent oxidoreductase